MTPYNTILIHAHACISVDGKMRPYLSSRTYKESHNCNMYEPVLKVIMMVGVGVAAVAFLLVAFSGSLLGQDAIGEDMKVEDDIIDEPAETSSREVIMPTKSSRPGCELESRCYIPEYLSVDAGSRVSWINQDAAFHSVTSGEYGDPDGMFDSGYMDPEERFEYVFNDPGQFLYHCTLHPWMSGVIDVKER